MVCVLFCDLILLVDVSPLEHPLVCLVVLPRKEYQKVHHAKKLRSEALCGCLEF